MRNKIFGRCGEAVAFNYLIENNYKILNTNFSCKLGEIDIIAQKDDNIVFVEVKARTSKLYGLPREAVTKEKQRHIKNTALFYLQKTNNLDKFCRFDVIEILDGKINHIENAFS